MRPIVVVGDVIDDVIVRPAAPIAPDTDTPARILRRPGGSGANVAAWLAHLGAAVRFAGRAGSPPPLPGVDARVAIDPDRPTGTIVVLVGADGTRTMLTDRGANEALCAEDLPPALLDGAALLHVSGYALFAPGPREATRALMAAAGEREIPVFVDCASAAFLRGAPGFADWIAGAALVFANEAEAAVLGELSNPLVVVKRGAAGVRIGELSLPAAPASVVDPTGAGDAFCAGFLHPWVAGEPLEACAHAALDAAAQAVARPGGRPTPGPG